MATTSAYHVPHHFPSAENQAESTKLGMWIFLATELLLFSGLFCAYAVFRMKNPELFHQMSRQLDWKLGGINTIVLICSSLTMALAIYFVQRNKRQLAAVLLIVTLLCAATFLGIKFMEYSHKFHTCMLPGTYFNPPAHIKAQITAPNPQIFLGIYFASTGLHGLHVILGMIAISWVLVRTLRGHFGPVYHGPVEAVGLYWHLVDLIWIYLFPLLYLVG